MNKKYYGVFDCKGLDDYELRYDYENERYVVFENVMDALIEANEVNLNRETPICVVMTISVKACFGDGTLDMGV